MIKTVEFPYEPPLWVAWFDGRPTEGAVGGSADEARENLIWSEIPRDQGLSLREGERHWVCYRDHVHGIGNSPLAAYKNWELRWRSTWHPTRLLRLFKSMEDAATQVCVTEDHDQLDVANAKRVELLQFQLAVLRGQIQGEWLERNIDPDAVRAMQERLLRYMNE